MVTKLFLLFRSALSAFLIIAAFFPLAWQSGWLRYLTENWNVFALKIPTWLRMELPIEMANALILFIAIGLSFLLERAINIFSNPPDNEELERRNPLTRWAESQKRTAPKAIGFLILAIIIAGYSEYVRVQLDQQITAIGYVAELASVEIDGWFIICLLYYVVAHLVAPRTMTWLTSFIVIFLIANQLTRWVLENPPPPMQIKGI